ncbi:hypothetical protein MNBD_ALPHA12-1118 [hydrothermal vent metagenome]|uniref:Uncharacterized protein n=1 Tax=hydrothermal vent metagenome TaxID=652676 RepID=A0A3B0TKR1_9ZZZZ
MSNKDPFSNNSDQDQTSEMSDEARLVIGKARRSFGFSMSIMLLGFMAIVLAFVYRATREEKSAAVNFSVEEVVLPAGSAVRSMVPFKDLIAITYENGGEVKMRMLDSATGEVLREIKVTKETTSPAAPDASQTNNSGGQGGQ